MSLPSSTLLGAACLLLISSVVRGQCVSTINALELLEITAGEIDPTFSQGRTYVLCSYTLFGIGELDKDNKPVNGQEFIRARPNLHLKCGDDGKVTNNCIVTGGDLQFDGTSFFGNYISEISNITIEGLTFSNTQRYSIWASKPGDITFRDCTFTGNTVAQAPLMFEYFDSSDQTSELAVTFIGCTFSKNKFYGDGANPAIVTANGEQNRMTFTRNYFQDNDYIFNNTKFTTASFLVESSGPLSTSRNCFFNNLVGVSPFAVYGGEGLTSDENYGLNSSGTVCQFVSSFETISQFDAFTPTCVTFESATDCTATTTSGPSSFPTMVPSGTPSLVSSVTPSRTPSISPSYFPSERGDTAQPTSTSSSQPSSGPTTSLAPSATTASPTVIESTSPTVTESASPTVTNSISPSLTPFMTQSPFPSSPPIPSPAPSNPDLPTPTSASSKLVSVFASVLTVIVTLSCTVM